MYINQIHLNNGVDRKKNVKIQDIYMPISYDVHLLDKACKEFCLPESNSGLFSSLMGGNMSLLNA